MKFLSKLGQILIKGTQIITGLGPLFPQVAPHVQKVTDTLEKIIAIVVNVEVFGQVLGTIGIDKLKAATPLVSQIILQSDLLVGKKINDPVLFNKGVASITSGVADILNSVKDDIPSTEVN